MDRPVRPVCVAALIAVVSVALMGCDPGWDVGVSNQSDHTVLLAVFDGSESIIYVPAGKEGLAYTNLGVGQRGLSVLNADCSLVTTLQTGDQGSFFVTIAPDGTPTVGDSTGHSDLPYLQRLSSACDSDSNCTFAMASWPPEVTTSRGARICQPLD